jgi:hypothetical protein
MDVRLHFCVGKGLVMRQSLSKEPYGMSKGFITWAQIHDKWEKNTVNVYNFNS